jgi:hypothetical protein
MDDDALDALVRRLTALVVKIDERDTTIAVRLERYDALLEAQHTMNQRVEGFMQRQDSVNDRLTTAIERLDALMRDVFRQRDNGHEA